jgi:hypothetical protein
MLVAARLSLYAQIALTVAALTLAGVALTSRTTTRYSGLTVTGGVMASGPVIVCGVLLLVAGIMGWVALRLRRLYLRSSIILCAPLVLALASSLSAPSTDGDVYWLAISADDIGLSIQKTLRLLEWSSWLILVAVLLSALSALLLLLLRRRRATE